MRTTRTILYSTTAHLRIRGRSRLPHFELDHAIYFVTWRLADSLPQHVAEDLQKEWKWLGEQLQTREMTPAARSALLSHYSKTYEGALDEGFGSCILSNRDAAHIVQGALLFFDQQRYDLFAWAVMPNHVHVVFFLERGDQLDRVLHSWKSFTAHRINQRLDRRGKLWQDEYFDRIVRDERELEQTIQYVINNPAAAGMQDWPFVGAKFRGIE